MKTMRIDAEVAEESGKFEDPSSSSPNGRNTKHKRFDHLVNNLNIKVREMNKTISVRGGTQNFKWLAFTAKFWYSRNHRFRDHPDKYVVTDVRAAATNDNLMPMQIIKERVKDKDVINVTLEARDRGGKAPRKMSMWEAVAYTAVNRWQFLNLQPKFIPNPLEKRKERGSGDEEDNTSPPMSPMWDTGEKGACPRVVRYWCNLDGWLEPQIMNCKEKKHSWKPESRVLMPPNCEFQFYFEVDGEKHLASNYKRKKVLIRKSLVMVNYYQIRPFLPNLSHETKAEEEMEEEEEEDDEELENKEPEDPVYLYQLVDNPTPEETETCFEADWKELQILDIVRKQEDRDGIRKLIKKNYVALRDIFQRLCGREIPLEYMGANEFLAFCKDTGLIRDGFTVTFVPIVFKRVNIMEIQTEENRGKGWTLYEDPTNPETLFTRSEWIESLVRIANYYNKGGDITERFEKVVDLTIRKWEVEIREDRTRDFMKRSSTKKTFQPYLERVYSMFERFAHSNKNLGATRFMCIDEYSNFVSAIGISSMGILRRHLNQAVAYSQSPKQDDERGYQTDFPEYLEMIARLAFFAYPGDKQEEALKKMLNFIIAKGVALEMIEPLEAKG
eukprot:CAMPEP_0184486470 /NCGR_PEP_ID=MMETSP0113_2-20130426/7961_1 /TAXON_ID=91329 /ORGANISM="Norrisiella sphaerica, Strain BC52" /LENGTH=613 /DNA_ID=CAMNT_0026868365 /DNA_START=193 /DNA_END=2034 /DNA_ORIENTATION=+